MGGVGGFAIGTRKLGRPKLGSTRSFTVTQRKLGLNALRAMGARGVPGLMPSPQPRLRAVRNYTEQGREYKVELILKTNQKMAVFYIFGSCWEIFHN